MFQDAVQQLKPHYEFLGWTDLATRKQILAGVGVFVSSNVFLTVNHLIKSRDASGFVLYQGGQMRKATVCFSDEQSDFAILNAGETVEVIAKGCEIDPEKHPFPTFRKSFPRAGMSVGYLSRFSRRDERGKDRSYTMFTVSHISYHLHDEPGNFIALCPAFAEPGFSGSPVFTSARELVGLISQGMEFRRQSKMFDVTTVPLVTPIYPHFDAIADAIADHG